jgi:hypothetical protein
LLFVALKGHRFIGYGKRHSELLEVSGHDFSRAENVSKFTRALAPEEAPVRLASIFPCKIIDGYLERSTLLVEEKV